MLNQLRNLYNEELAQHLLSRHLDLSLHSCFESDGSAVFPLWNLSGKMVGLQHYRPFASKDPNNDLSGRYCTRVHYGDVAVWGMESWSLSNTLFVCEGLFDAAKVTSCGYSAVALLGSTPSPSVVSWLKTLSRHTVALLDDDGKGKAMARACSSFYQLLNWHDMGDMPMSEAKSLLDDLAF